MIDNQRIECDGHVYRLRPWEYKDGQRWILRIVSALGAAAGAGPGNELAAAALVVRSFDEETLAQLIDTCEKYTDLVGRDEAGNETIQPLATVRAAHMRRRYVTMVQLVKEHMLAEYGDFFARVPQLVGDARAKASAK